MFEQVDDYGNKLTYKPGDYILLNIKQIFKNLEESTGTPDFDDLPYDKVKITDIISNGEYPYRIMFPNSKQITSVGQDEIIRKLTDEEIEDFKTLLDSNKYNL